MASVGSATDGDVSTPRSMTRSAPTATPRTRLDRRATLQPATTSRAPPLRESHTSQRRAASARWAWRAASGHRPLGDHTPPPPPSPPPPPPPPSPPLVAVPLTGSGSRPANTTTHCPTPNCTGHPHRHAPPRCPRTTSADGRSATTTGAGRTAHRHRWGDGTATRSRRLQAAGLAMATAGRLAWTGGRHATGAGAAARWLLALTGGRGCAREGAASLVGRRHTATAGRLVTRVASPPTTSVGPPGLRRQFRRCSYRWHRAG